jgi:hypothetical protein
MSLNAVYEQVALAETPPISRTNVVFAAERLLVAASEACLIAERLTVLADTPDRGEDAAEAAVAAEQIARTIAWLNEAQGALLFG